MDDYSKYFESCFYIRFAYLGYTLLHVIEFLLELGLWTQTPDFVPIHTEDGILVKNPAVGYIQFFHPNI